MIETAAQALALLREARVVTLVPTPGLRSLVAEVAGEKVRGSWWGHKKGKLIFRLASALEDSGEALCAKLAYGKVTFVHRSLWPALYRTTTDKGFVRERVAGLSAGGRALYTAVERAGELRADEVEKRLLRARDELARSALVLSTQEHTESGRHETVLRAWKRWARDEVKAAARGIGIAEAEEALRAAGLQFG